MAIYSLSNRTTNVTIANPCIEIYSAATVKARIMEIGIFMAAATASVFGIGRAAAIGVTPTTPVTMLAEEVNDPAGLVYTAIAWATPPTVPVNFFRRVSLAAAIGTGVIFTFPKGLTITHSTGSIVVWNITGNTGVSDIHFVVEV